MASVEIQPAISILIGFFLSYLALGAAGNYAAHEKASGSLVVTGNVFCDTCLEQRLSENGYVISGASVALECSLNRKTTTISITAETDENGEFKMELPSNIFHSADPLKKCSVKPLRSPYDYCSLPSKSAPSSLTLQSESNGVLTYNAGSFSYRHETVPAKCYSGDFLRMMRGRAMAENVDESSKAVQQTPTIPSLPNFPVPTLPNFRIPTLPTIPSLPNVPPLPTIPSIPSLTNAPPLPIPTSVAPQAKTPTRPPLSVPHLAKTPTRPPLSVPHLAKTPTLPPLSVAPLAKIPPPLPIPTSVAPLAKTPTRPPLSVPHLAKTPTRPPLSVPHLAKTPTLPPLSVAPLAKIPPPLPIPTSVPPFPHIPNFQVPPIPFLTPPPPGH